MTSVTNMDLSSESSPQPQQPLEKPARSPEPSEAFRTLLEQLASLPTPEEKLAAGLLFMRSSVSQEGTPRFKEFWEARTHLLPLFRENLNPVARGKLWEEYVELTVEARRLKEILEEQSAFAVEQIELAIQALEADIANFSSLVEQMEDLPLPQDSEVLSGKMGQYAAIQKELGFLNTLASRLNSLRKEALKTDMRMRSRSKIFKKLSELGDFVFPKRKERIEAISEAFSQDIASFAENHFGSKGVRGAPHFALREEIKALQGLAKVFTLSSKAFTETRMELSRCWDQLREVEKERRKEITEKRQASSEQRAPIEAKIQALREKAEGLSLKELDAEIEEIVKEMRALSLDRDDVRFLRADLDQLRSPHLAEMEKRAKEAEEAEKERLRLQRERYEAIKGDLSTLLKEIPSLSLEEAQEKTALLEKEIGSVSIPKMEKQNWERQMRALRDLLAEKKEEALLNLSEDDKKALENLRLALKQKKERRQEIKAQLETHRKSLGGSGLDFEKAMQLQEIVEQEKDRLEKVDQSIAEVEGKIAELES